MRFLKLDIQEINWLFLSYFPLEQNKELVACKKCSVTMVEFYCDENNPIIRLEQTSAGTRQQELGKPVSWNAGNRY